MRKFALHIWNRLLIIFNKVDYSYTLVAARPNVNEIPPKVIVVVGHKNFPKWVLMQCPCGCKDLLTLSLMKKFDPFWSYEADNWNRITLSPSVWKNDGCRSHFFIKKGKLIWCKN